MILFSIADARFFILSFLIDGEGDAAFPRYTSLRYVRYGCGQSFASPGVKRFFGKGRPPRGVGWASLARVVTESSTCLTMLSY